MPDDGMPRNSRVSDDCRTCRGSADGKDGSTRNRGSGLPDGERGQSSAGDAPTAGRCEGDDIGQDDRTNSGSGQAQLVASAALLIQSGSAVTAQHQVAVRGIALFVGEPVATGGERPAATVTAQHGW